MDWWTTGLTGWACRVRARISFPTSAMPLAPRFKQRVPSTLLLRNRRSRVPRGHMQRLEIELQSGRPLVFGHQLFLHHVERLAHGRLVDAVQHRGFLRDPAVAKMVDQRLLEAVPAVHDAGLDDLMEIAHL